MTKQKTLTILIIMLVFFATVIGCFSLIVSMPKADASDEATREIYKIDFLDSSSHYSGRLEESYFGSILLVPDTVYFFCYSYEFVGLGNCENIFLRLGYGPGGLNSATSTFLTKYYDSSSKWIGTQYIEFRTPEDLPPNTYLHSSLWTVDATYYVFSTYYSNSFLIVGGTLSDYLNFMFSGSYADGYSNGFNDGYFVAETDYSNDYSKGYSDGLSDGKSTGQGKNLFKPYGTGSYYKLGVDYSIDNDYLININGTYTGVENFPEILYKFDGGLSSGIENSNIIIPFEIGSFYTVNLHTFGGLVPSGAFSITFRYDVGGVSMNKSINLSSPSFTFPSGCEGLTRVFLYWGNGATFNNFKIGIQLEKNSVATPYVPYTQSFNELLEESYFDGYDKGKTDGKAEQGPISYRNGYVDGRAEEAPISYELGLIDGKKAVDTSYNSGYDSGYNVGYTEGLGTGVGNSSLGAVGGTINATLGMAIKSLDTIGSIDIFGIKIWSIIGLAVAIGIVLFIWRLIVNGKGS